VVNLVNIMSALQKGSFVQNLKKSTILPGFAKAEQ
jgi:hypothetical protein